VKLSIHDYLTKIDIETGPARDFGILANGFRPIASKCHPTGTPATAAAGALGWRQLLLLLLLRLLPSKARGGIVLAKPSEQST